MTLQTRVRLRIGNGPKESFAHGIIGTRKAPRACHALVCGNIAPCVAARFTVALWSIDSKDYGERDPSVIAQRCSPPNVSDGDVLLFHEGQQWTLAALPRIVSAHLQFVECLIH